MRKKYRFIQIACFLFLLFCLSACSALNRTKKESASQITPIDETTSTYVDEKTSDIIGEAPETSLSIHNNAESSSVTQKEETLETMHELALSSLEPESETAILQPTIEPEKNSDIVMPAIEIPIEEDASQNEGTHASTAEEGTETAGEIESSETEATNSTDENGDIVLPGLPF